jgi:exosortase D (VPLPA-CTERM-specific)
MSSTLDTVSPAPTWRDPPARIAVAGAVAVVLVLAFFPGLEFMLRTWQQVEEYSYGYLIPVVVAFLVWQKSDLLRQHELKGSWAGLALVASALLLGVLGNLSAIRLFSQYGFVVALYGVAVCHLGWRGTRIIAVPLAVALFMIPLPQFVLRELSQQLQLLSSQIGVAMIRLFGISVFLEGNVIDLGTYKLQVVEACSGLRYLFPLLALGFLAAYFFQAAMWKRVAVVMSTIPLTIVINSLRIALIGVTVEHWGSSMAEGLLHDFEGWFMFMICIALLVAEMGLLARLGERPKSLRSVFGLDFPAPLAKGTQVAWRKLSAPVVAATLLLAGFAAVAFALPANGQTHPARAAFIEFPLRLDGGWRGRMDYLDSDVLAALQVDDHFIASYSRAGEPWVNFYAAYYASQSGGQSSHSPRTCIPGGGWEISELAAVEIAADARAAERFGPVHVNRAVIQKGDQRQLVYYWFSQRGRTLTSELAVKWYILFDSVTRDRSDGALVRLVTPVLASEQIAQAEHRLLDFVAAAGPRLSRYVPD